MKTTGLDAVLNALRGDSGLPGAEKAASGGNPEFTAAFDAAARSAEQPAPAASAGKGKNQVTPSGQQIAAGGKSLPESGRDVPADPQSGTGQQVAGESNNEAVDVVAVTPALTASPFVKDALEKVTSGRLVAEKTGADPVRSMPTAPAPAMPSPPPQTIRPPQPGQTGTAPGVVSDPGSRVLQGQPPVTTTPGEQTSFTSAVRTAVAVPQADAAAVGRQPETPLAGGPMSTNEQRSSVGTPMQSQAGAQQSPLETSQLVAGVKLRSPGALSGQTLPAEARPPQTAASSVGADTVGRWPVSEPAVRSPAAESTGRSPALDASVRSPAADVVGRPPAFDVAVRSAVADPTGRSPALDASVRSPAAEVIGRSPAFDVAVRSAVADPTGRSPALDASVRSPAAEVVGRSPAADPTGRSPALDASVRSPAAEVIGRSPAGAAVRSSSLDVSGRPPPPDMANPSRAGSGSAAPLPTGQRGAALQVQGAVDMAPAGAGVRSSQEGRPVDGPSQPSGLADKNPAPRAALLAAGLRPATAGEAGPLAGDAGSTTDPLKTPGSAVQAPIPGRHMPSVEARSTGPIPDLGTPPEVLSRASEAPNVQATGLTPAPSRAADSVPSQPVIQLPDIRQAPQATDFPQEILARVRMIQSQNGTEARLNLHPAELGRLQIAISSEGEATRVAFVVDNAQAKEALEQAMPRLREFLQQAGLQLTDSSVAQQGSQGNSGFKGDDEALSDRGILSGHENEGEERPSGPPGTDPNRIVDAYA